MTAHMTFLRRAGKLFILLRMKLLLLALIVAPALGLDNGLARTPPMGWLTWERFRCNVDCTNDPDNCISEKLLMQMADHMAADGYKDAGYEYVIVDDCWLAKERDSSGRLQPDPDRFPSGIKALADYVHGKGLKFGIYEDFGTKTCGGYPGSEYYLQMDAQTFADWGVDYLKLDGCYSDVHQYDDAYPAMSMWMNRTGRPMVFSCSWPAYQEGAKIKPNYPLIAKYCNLWRNYGDISDSWDAVVSITDFYGTDATQFVEVAGPGNFNDPDMLIIGNYGLSSGQEKVQMGMWAMMASPLIMSTDLRNVRPEAKALLQNSNVISINQDPLGKQAKRLEKSGDIQVWSKALVKNGFAFALLNTGTGGTPSKVTVKLSDLGFQNLAGYNISEVFSGTNLGIFKPTDSFTQSVDPTGIFLGKAVPVAAPVASRLPNNVHRWRLP